MKAEIMPPIGGQSRIARFNTDRQQITSEYMSNVVPQDFEGRIRLCKRFGADKWSTDQIGSADQPIVCLLSVSTIK